jgi:HAMP domain-containing protein
MFRLPKIINKTLSVRLSLIVVSAMAILLMATLTVMLYYSKKALKEEALEKVSQTLEGTVQSIDNILLSVEQTTGNIYFNLMPHLDQPDMMYTYSCQIVESNKYVAGCAIAFRENFYQGHDLFMPYFRRENIGGRDTIIQVETFANGPYTEQVWYTRPMESARPEWLNPLTGLGNDTGEAPIFTFSLPLYGADGKTAGVVGVDVKLSQLSQIVSATKPSANSYCLLLDSDGTFIVRPSGNKSFLQTAFSLYGDDADVGEAVKAMVSGETGYKPFRLNGIDYYVFFKPFKRAAVPGRSMEKLEWSVGIIYPEDDIFGDYNSLSTYVLAVAVVGLLLLFFCCRVMIHRQLKPLLMLTASAQRIAKGKYNELIPDSRQADEVGRLQDNFQKMQQSLSTSIGELEQLKTTLQQHGEDLDVAYNQAQKADRMKTAFLHNMTNQMIGPAEAIDRDVSALCNDKVGNQDISQLSDDIQQKGNTIAELLDNLINISADEKRKEVADD